MKIAFYIDNENHRGVDYSNPEGGNPGIGGTHFMFWTVAYYLDKMYEDVSIYILAPIIDTMPQRLYCYECKNPVEAVGKSRELGIDILVLRGPKSDKALFNKIEECQQKIVFWSHNREDFLFANYANKCKYVVRNVCVGKEQMDRLRDHLLFEKSTYIYNALDFATYGYNKTLEAKDKIVGYMGSLTPNKGFHRLAKVWKSVLKQVPDAKLYVLGGGNLYGKQWKLGKKNIANAVYEKRFLKYLVDDNGEIIPSVHFCGIVSGEEKLSLLNKIKVGVANPIGKETFCIVAIEFQYMNVPVVTVRKDGVLDTVRHNDTGLLFRSDKEFVEYLVRLLNDDERNSEMGEKANRFVKDTFDIYVICEKWYGLFTDILSGVANKIDYEATNWFNDFKWLREINRRIKSVRILYWLPSLLWYRYVIATGYKKIISLKRGK